MGKLNKAVFGFMGVVMMGSLAMGSALAQEELAPSHLKAAKEALNASGATKPFDNILPEIAQNIKSGLIQTRPDLNDDITNTTDEEAIAIATRRADLESEAARIYAKIFSEEELKQISQFYNSPAGKKFISEAPILARELSRASQVWGNGIQRDLSVKVRAKLKAKGLE